MVKNLMIILASIIIGVAFFGNSCLAQDTMYLAKKGKHHKHKKGKKHQYVYHYYPGSYVYFMPGENVYFYLQGHKWKKSPHLPKGMKKGEYVIIETETHEPYIYFEEHKKKHKVKKVVGYRYHYYPDCYVYYYPGEKIYYYRDKKKWKKAARLPPGLLMGSHVFVDTNSRQPYLMFEQHRKKYRPKTHKLSINIPPHLYQRLKRLAAQRGTTMTAIVLESIEKNTAGHH